MVYHGVFSKGCERCRQRKVKCDQRKPTCSKCEKIGKQCPGYRDLHEVLFRDESKRVIQRARQCEPAECPLAAPISPKCLKISTPHPGAKPRAPWLPPMSIPLTLSQSVNDLGASFLFAKYFHNEPPFYSHYHAWVTQSYYDSHPRHVLRATIEAVGMAGLANVLHSPRVKSASEEQYRKASHSMREALNDPVETTADTTLLAVIFFEFLETVIFESWDRYPYWEAQVKIALALLELRGPEQFKCERGGQLYLQARAQILLACMRRRAPVPPGLVRATILFEASPLRLRWRRHHVASPGSILEIGFRLVNLYAAAFAGCPGIPAVCGGVDGLGGVGGGGGQSAGEGGALVRAQDAGGVREAARRIEADLVSWREGAPRGWRFDTVDSDPGAVDAEAGFGGKTHVYANLWIAEAWNNWRALRLVLNQIIARNEARAGEPDEALRVAAEEVVREMSAEVCVSVANFVGTPRVISLIQPLYLVALEELNNRRMRAYAVDMLTRIDAATGVRQAGLMARTVLGGQAESPGAFGSMSGHLSILLLPSRSI